MTVSRATGFKISDGKRQAWRITAPVSEIKNSLMATVDVGLYAVETVGIASMTIAGTLGVLSPPESTTSVLINIYTSMLKSIISLRPIRMALAYPDVAFGWMPLLYAYIRWRSISGQKAKVQVITTVNNYLGTGTTRKSVTIDLAEVALAVQDAVGITQLAVEVLSFRDSVRHVGLGVTASAYYGNYRRLWAQRERRWIDYLFLILTWPLSIASSTLVGYRRNNVVPDVSPPSEVHRERSDHEARPELPPVNMFGNYRRPTIMVANRLVETLQMPSGLPLELFVGDHTLRSGERMPEIAVCTDPRLQVKLPFKPVCNNTFAFDCLKMCTGSWTMEIERIMKVPPTPFHASVEMQKFSLPENDHDFNMYSVKAGMTEKRFLLTLLRQVLKITSADRIHIGSTLAMPVDNYLTSDSKKRHPGWRTRAFLGQRKIDAWDKSIPIAQKCMNEMLTGYSEELKKHTWLFLPVVKKNATRKDLFESRCRGAVIPELYLQQLWMYMLKPIIDKLGEKGPASWMAKFELFNGHLNRVWEKMHVTGIYSNEDKVDHGASLRKSTSKIVSEFCGSLILLDGDPALGTVVFDQLMYEMINGKVGLPDQGGNVHIYLTQNGIKDGVYDTGKLGGFYTIIGEGHKIWKNWHTSDSMQEMFPNIMDVSKMITAQISSDNSLICYPQPLAFLSGVHPEQAKVMKEIGLLVKPEESLLTPNLTQAYVMSWRMSNISAGSSPLIVGWKPTHEMLKGFFYPEKLLDYDFLNESRRSYIGEIIVSLYIMGYWNIEVRMFLTYAWQLLWMGIEEEIELDLRHITDFEFKTGLERAVIGRISSKSAEPYDGQAIVKLWLGKDLPQYVGAYAKEGPTPAEAQTHLLRLSHLRESQTVYNHQNTIIEREIEDVDETVSGMSGAF